MLERLDMNKKLTELRIWGRDGQISLTKPFQFWSSRMIEGKYAGRWHSMQPLPTLASPDVELLERFARSIIRGEPPEVTGVDGVRLQAVIEAAYESVRLGRPVKVERAGW